MGRPFQSWLPGTKENLHDILFHITHPETLTSARRVLREYFGPNVDDQLRSFGIHISMLSVNHPPSSINGQLAVVRADGEGKIFTREGNYLLELEKGVSGDCHVIVYENGTGGKPLIRARKDFTEGDGLENQSRAATYVHEMKEKIRSGIYH